MFSKLSALFLLGFLPFSIQEKDGWIYCKNTKVYDVSNSATVTTFDVTDAESMVIYFYTSMIRKDDKFKEVLPEEKYFLEELQRALKEYATWNFKSFHLLQWKKFEGNGIYIKLYFEIEYKGKIDKGTDEVTLQKVNGRWVITDLPT